MGVHCKRIDKWRPGLYLAMLSIACATALFVQPVVSMVARAGMHDPLQPVHSGIPHDALFDMVIDDHGGVAVGDHGLIVRSGDRGQTWRDHGERLGEAALLGIGVADRHGVIVGQEGVVYVSEDRSVWRRVDSGVDVRLMNVDLSTRGVAVAVGAFGTLLRSTDSGQTWTPVQVDWDALLTETGYEPHLYDVTVDANDRVLVVGEFGLVMRSTDGGQSWSGVHTGEASLFALHLRPDGTGYAVGQRGTVLRTTDDGLTWTPLATPTESNLLGVWSSAVDDLVVVGIREMLRSSDGGATFVASDDPRITRSWYQALATDTKKRGSGPTVDAKAEVYAAGEGASITRLID
jgi:photosystem II stability/assembly factor-like uncharacterized protein